MTINVSSRGRGVRLALPAAGAALVWCAGCTSVGSRQLPIDRFDYNTAIADSANQQMLLNLVRLHHGEVPTFLAVNSVLTQYAWSGDVGVSGASGDSLGFPAWTVGGSANARYIERPTVTYSPLSGQEFATQMLSPVRAEVVFSLVSSGWPPEELLSMTIHRINDVRNAGFAPAGAGPTGAGGAFPRVVELIVELARRDAIELVRAPSDDPEASPSLAFSESPSPEAAPLIREFKDLVGLDPGRSRFRVTRKIVGRAPDEITIRTHSLLELMGLLSAGVDPAPGGGAGLVAPGAPGASCPLVVRSLADRPVDALAAVQYAGAWYYIARSDEASKRAFGLPIYLFQMQASQSPGAGPLITVPIG